MAGNSVSENGQHCPNVQRGQRGHLSTRSAREADENVEQSNPLQIICLHWFSVAIHTYIFIRSVCAASQERICNIDYGHGTARRGTRSDLLGVLNQTR